MHFHCVIIFCDEACHVAFYIELLPCVCIECYQGHVEMYGGYIDNNTLSLLTLSRLPLSVSRHTAAQLGEHICLAATI